MKLKKLLIAGIICLSLTVVLLFFDFKIDASSLKAGSMEDPLITKAYFEEEIEKIREEFNQLSEQGSDHTLSSNNDLDSIIETIDNSVDIKIEELKKEVTKDNNAYSPDTFIVVELEKGQKLLCEAGTELILRGGQVTAINNEAGDGLTDITAGKDLKTGEEIKLNHLLIVPRTDGRGLASQSKSWIMVKGSYEVQ
ncbi:MAG: hypothetical protein ACLFMO_00105 [Eubacteriales bacterium]